MIASLRYKGRQHPESKQQNADIASLGCGKSLVFMEVETLTQYEEYLCRYDCNTTSSTEY